MVVVVVVVVVIITLIHPEGHAERSLTTVPRPLPGFGPAYKDTNSQVLGAKNLAKVHQMPQIAPIVPVISQIHLPSLPPTLAVATSLPSTLVATSLARPGIVWSVCTVGDQVVAVAKVARYRI